MKRIAMFAMIVFAPVVVLIVGLWILVFALEYPGGMRSSYKPSDHDRRLTSVAREAAPIIETVDRYYRAHGRCQVGGDWAELRQTLPANLIVTSLNGNAGEFEFRQPQWSPGVSWLYFAETQALRTMAQARMGSLDQVAMKRGRDAVDLRSGRWQRRNRSGSRCGQLAVWPAWEQRA